MSKNNNDKKRNRILFDFESIVDLKLSMIKRKIFEKGYPIQDFELNEYKMKRMFINTDILNGIEYSYDEYIHPDYPVFTGMKTLIEAYQKEATGIIYPVVLCKDGFQQRIIKETFRNIKILVGSRDNVNTLNFSRIVLSELDHALEFKDPTTVDFMILNFRENFDKNNMELLNPEILAFLGDVNTFTIAKAYPEIKDPVG